MKVVDRDERNRDEGAENQGGEERGGQASRSRERRPTSRQQYRGGGRYSGGRGYRGRQRVCYFCSNKITAIDYKAVDTLRRFVTDRGKIRPRRQTGTCARHQRGLATAIKRARHLALLPFSSDFNQV